MGVWEIARRRTSSRRSGGNESAAWSAWRSLAAILTKAKNTKCRSYNCFFLLRFFGNHRDTSRIYQIFVKVLPSHGLKETMLLMINDSLLYCFIWLTKSHCSSWMFLNIYSNWLKAPGQHQLMHNIITWTTLASA
jgi:hypothetical protein